MKTLRNVARMIVALCAGVLVLSLLSWIGLVNGWYGNAMTQVNASDKAIALSRSTSDLTFISDDLALGYMPSSPKVDAGFVLYPGAMCDPRGYLPVLAAIAAKGYLALVAVMPSNMAITDADRVLALKGAYPDIPRWVLGGHSIGGGAALMFAGKHADVIDGLIMWDSYTYKLLAMTSLDLPIASVYGTGHHNPERPKIFAQARQYLPPETRYVSIEGGDHYQFGSFREQDLGEKATASISEEEQHRQLVAATVAFVESIKQ